MTKHCIILFFLFFALAVQELNGFALETLSNAWASQSGEVAINKDSYGFYVDVDYAYQPSSSSNMGKMLLGLSNSETLLSYTCYDFDSYYCGQHNCTAYPSWVATIDYPSMSAYGYHVTTDVYLDYSNWKLGAYAYIGTQCKSGGSSLGRGRVGIIGLGNEDGSSKNFINSTFFSIYFDKNLTGGKLLFRYEPSISATKNPIVLSSDQNWRIRFSNGYINVGNFKNYFSGTLIFDIHAKAIGLPEIVFNNTVDFIKSTLKVSCTSNLTNPTCDYYGYLSKLPTLKLSTGNDIIKLPPTVYVKNPTLDYHNGITLNLQALGSWLTGSNYVPSIFNYAVIMDAQFLSYYYLVFERYQVKFYVQGNEEPDPDPTPTPSPSPGAGPIIGCVLAFLLIVSVCCCIFKKMKKSPAPPSQTSQEPPLNVQPPYNPAPLQPNNGYVYPQNTYPVPQQHAQQPGGYIQQPGYYPPPQQYQQQRRVDYRA